MRNAIAAALCLWLTPVLAVAAGGFGVTVIPALLMAGASAAAVAYLSSRVLHRRIARNGLSTLLALALLVAAAVAIARIGTLSVFMADVSRPQFSVEPDDGFRRVHSCLSAYIESARFLSEGGHNVYELALYEPNGQRRFIGPLRVDPFHYPPPFMLLPQAIRIVAPDFWDFRRLWFALQALTLAAAGVGLAAWIGGRCGAVALLAAVLLLGLPHTAATFQQGNFQITAVPLAAVAFVLLMVGRHAAGSSLLAYAALAKIFPGILVVPLLAAREWKRCAWVAGAGMALLAITFAVQGSRAFRDFVSTSLPEISSGAAFPQTESRAHSRVNWSAYGETVRLRHLGVTSMTQRRGLAVAQVYGVCVAALAAWVGWKRRFDLSSDSERLALVQVTVALISLASFRSPFVGAIYGCVATLWLMALCAAAATSTWRQWTWLGALCGLAWVIWIIPSPGSPPSQPWLWITLVLFLVSVAVNLWAVSSAVSTPQPSAPVARSVAV